MDGSALLAALTGAAGVTNGKAKTKKEESEWIHFNGMIDSFPVHGNKVHIVPYSSGDHELGSSKLQINNVVNFGWANEYMPGQMVAVNNTGHYLAYAIVTPERKDGVVRVMNMKSEQRVLLKGMKGAVKDLAFAHTKDEVMLGCVDETGAFFVFSIHEMADSSMESKLLLQVNGGPDRPPTKYQRIVWCPYLPDDEEDECDKLLAVTRGNVAEMWDIDIILKTYGPGVHEASKISQGTLLIKDHKDDITDAAFSPDGSALATASLDGQVKFFQVYMPGGKEPPRCLHEWAPHDGAPVSSLFFLDNYKDQQADESFWKYCLTGSKFNSEFKLWSCETWTCLQTIGFNPNDGDKAVLKASLDLTGKFLVLSDIHRKNVYVFQLQLKDNKMKVASISEFATPSAFLCISMLSAGLKMTRSRRTIDDMDDNSDYSFSEEEEEEGDDVEATVVEFMLVQPKSLQSCKIVYQDAVQSLDQVKTIKLEPEDEFVSIPKVEPGLAEAERNGSDQLQEAADKMITLMSPEAFTKSANASKAPAKEVINVDDEVLLSPSDIKQEPQESKSKLTSLLRSGASSPSREVQDILSEQDEVKTELFEDCDDAEDSDDESEGEADPDDEEEEPMEATLTEALKQALFISETTGKPQQQQQTDKKTNEWPGPPQIEPKAMASGASVPVKVEPLATGSEVSGSEMSTLLQNMATMTSLLKQQQNELRQLRADIKAMKTKEKTALQETMKKNTDQIIKDSKAKNEALLNNLNKKLEGLVRQELKKLAPGAIKDAFQGVANTFEQDAKTRVLKSDQMFREILSKSATSKNLTDALATKIQPVVQNSFKDVFGSVIIPAFERAMQQMLTEASDSILKGLKEHEGHYKKQVQVIHKEQTKMIVDQLMKELREKIPSVMAADKSSLDRIVASVRDVVSSELQDSFNRSTNATPVQSPAANSSFAELSRQIKSSLVHGNLDEAFQTALSANNLALVVATCEMVNPMQIFSKDPCPLSQASLLALVQQLGHQLDRNTEIKHRYLEEAIMALNPHDPLTSQHISAILEGLRAQIDKFMKAHPNDKIAKQMKMLRMATFSLH